MQPADVLASARVFALPMHREFRGITVRKGLVFEGPSGWAEFAPFHDHTDAHAARWLDAAIEQAYGQWPSPMRDSVPVNAIIPMCDAATAHVLTEQALVVGCSVVKVKVGSADFDDDVQRVAAIRSALDDAGVQGAIRIDVNRGWTLAQAVDRIAVLDAVAGGLEYAEQPVAEELRELRRAVTVPIAVDEGVRLAADPIAAIRALQEVADVVVLKAIPLGGVLRALEVADACALPVVVSGSLDTAVGLASGLWLASLLPNLPFACGLATGALFAQDVIAAPQTVVDGRLTVRREVPEQFDPLGLVDEAMRERWHQRLQRAWEYSRHANAEGSGV